MLMEAEMVTTNAAGRRQLPMRRIASDGVRFVRILTGISTNYTEEDERRAVNAQMRNHGAQSFSYIRSAESAPSDTPCAPSDTPW